MTQDTLTNRIKKRAAHLKKWAKRTNTTCYRIYNKDLPDYPLLIDWYEGDAVAWIHNRKRDETPEQVAHYQDLVKNAIQDGLGITSEHLVIKSRARQKGLTTQYEKTDQDAITKVVQENGLKFEINLSNYLDTGLFLDHRQTRALCRDLSKGKRVLNLFAYTGSFTCYAIDGGAISTTTVDLSNTYSKWTQRNLALNNFPKRGSDRLIVDNCLSFIKLEAARNRYDLIICDPPTFSNSKQMRTSFNIDDHYPDLIKTCSKLLDPNGKLLFSTNSKSFKLNPEKLSDRLTIDDITQKTCSEDFKAKCPHQCWLITK